MHRHRRRARTPERQPELFSAPQPPVAGAAPGWSALPDQARHAVTALMTRLLITHASGTVPGPGSKADERRQDRRAAYGAQGGTPRPPVLGPSGPAQPG